jgi:hypothetical protein
MPRITRKRITRKNKKHLKNKKQKTAKRSSQCKRRVIKKVHGGDYSQSTITSVEGFPIEDEKVTMAMPGLPTMTVGEYRKHMEKVSQDPSSAYLD